MPYSRIASYAAMAGLLFALYKNWSWPWGLLFLVWTVPSIRSGDTFLIGHLTRRQDPVLFWFTNVLWVLLGLLMILTDAAPAAVETLYAFIWGY